MLLCCSRYLCVLSLHGSCHQSSRRLRRAPTHRPCSSVPKTLDFFDFFFAPQILLFPLLSCQSERTPYWQAAEGASKEVVKSSSKDSARDAAARASKKKSVKKRGWEKPWYARSEGPIPFEMAAVGIALALLLMFFFVVSLFGPLLVGSV